MRMARNRWKERLDNWLRLLGIKDTVEMFVPHLWWGKLIAIAAPVVTTIVGWVTGFPAFLYVPGAIIALAAWLLVVALLHQRRVRAAPKVIVPAESSISVRGPTYRAPQRDTPLIDAIWRIHLGRWSRGEVKKCSERELNALLESWRFIRQAAFDGTVSVWGKLGPVGSLYEPIPKEFWSGGNLNWESFTHEDPAGLWAIPSPSGYWGGPRGRGNYSELQTSRAQIDSLRPQYPVAANVPIKWALDYLVSNDGPFPGEPNDASDALRQEARDGRLVVRGRPDSGSLSVANYYKPREDISPEHWRDFDFDVARCFFADDARLCRTEPDDSRSRNHDKVYVDLEVSEAMVRKLWPR